MSALVLAALLASPPFLVNPTGWCPGGTCVGNLWLDDDVTLSFGNTLGAPDAAIEWDTSGTHQLRIWLTDVDGAGTDGVPLYWATGTDDAVMSGKLTLAGVLSLNGKSQVSSGTDSYVLMTDAAGTAFTGLRFACATNACPMWFRDGTTLKAKLADGSALTRIDGSILTAGSLVQVGSSGDFAFSGRGKISSPATGQIAVETVKVASTRISLDTESVTFPGGAGAASAVTVGSLIPDGAIIDGITTRVTTADNGGACTGYHVGDGADVDLYGVATTETEGTTTTPASATALLTNPQFGGPYEVTITGVGGNCIDMVVAITAHYRLLTAATSS